MKIGLTKTNSTIVDASNTAEALGSGDMPVFATPAMIALMERAALESVTPYMEDGQSTVGIYVDVSHDRATPLGVEVTAVARLIEIDGKRLVFEVEANDPRGIIGRGRHERFIVNRERFLGKL